MLRELIAALDALPEKRLAAESLVTEEGEFCSLGALGRVRGLDLTEIDSEDRDSVADAFGVAGALVAEVMFLNDECAARAWDWIDVEICGPVTPNWPDWDQHKRSVRIENRNVAEDRWRYMRDWATGHLKDKQ